MSINDLLSITEAAEMLRCTTDNVRRLVMEDRTMDAILASPAGNLSQFHAAVGLQRYDVDSDGKVTHVVGGAFAGNLRFSKADVVHRLAKESRGMAAGLGAFDNLPAADLQAENVADAMQDDRPTDDQPDYSVLATRDQLVDAFGRWGLKIEYFNDLKSRKWLLSARKVKGQGQRGRRFEPWFCPYAVMTGLIGSTRTSKRMSPNVAWRVLEHKFPKVHAKFESHDPRDQTGD